MKQRTARGFTALVLVLLMVIVSACSNAANDEASSQPGGSAPASASESASAPASPEASYDPMGKIDPPIEVIAIREVDPLLKYENGDTIEQNAWTKLYEQEFGIKLKYMWVTDPTQYDQKFNVTMASGKLPDIMPVNGIQFKQLVEADQLEDLSGALENYGTDRTKEVLSLDGGVGLESATFGGKLLGLPVNPGSTDGAPLLWVRTDWLKKLNLPEPKTMDDVFKIADAFVNQDPDGNGQKDTFGLGASKEFFGDLPGMQGFFNSYHAYLQIWVTDEAGQLGYGSIQPQAREALAKLQEMYKGGLIDREFGVKDSEKIIQAVNGGKLGLYYGAMWSPLVFGDGRVTDPEMDWMPFPLPSIDGTPAKPQTGFNIDQYFVVRKGFSNPEAVVKMMNAFHFRFDEAKYPPTEISQNGDVAKYNYALVTGAIPTQNLNAYARVKEALEKQDESLLDPTAPGQPIIYKAIQDFNAGDPAGWGYTRVFGEGSAQSLLYAYNESKTFQGTEFISGPTPTMVEKMPTLLKMELETFTKIIMGAAPIEAFDEFVADWKKLGGDAITQEVQAWKASK